MSSYTNNDDRFQIRLLKIPNTYTVCLLLSLFGDHTKCSLFGPRVATSRAIHPRPLVTMGVTFHDGYERASYLTGALILGLVGPPVALIVGTTVVWEAIDRGFKGGLVESNNELSGVVMGRIVPWITRITAPFNRRLVKHEADAFVVNFALYACVGLPLLLRTFGNLHLAAQSTGAAIGLCWLYHVIRLGPMFMNFAYVYSICHKEGHAAAARTGLFAKPFDRRGPFRYVFNWWVGLYFGILPSSFAVGHSINHHKYNNGPGDVISVADRPRDEWRWLVAYIPRFMAYATNVSTVRQFLREGKAGVAAQTAAGTAYYLAWLALVANVYGWPFACGYILYPFLEQSLMLSGINWVWHAFLDPEDVENEYVASITILGGTINVLNEDSHVVHHQYPGMHWTAHSRLLTRHADAYRKARGSVFYGTHTFEVLALILMADYDKLADRFLGYLPANAEAELFGVGKFDKNAVARPERAMPHAEAVELIKQRLRVCWWGPRAQHRDAALLSDAAGMKFTVAREWESGGALGWDEAEAPAAGKPVQRKAARTATSPARRAGK
jgi:hypothetical protein